jgi:hypothetical protein
MAHRALGPSIAITCAKCSKLLGHVATMLPDNHPITILCSCGWSSIPITIGPVYEIIPDGGLSTHLLTKELQAALAKPRPATLADE